MATTNIADWGVSHIDADGVYQGGTSGVAGGATTQYNSSGAVSVNDSVVILADGVAMTLADGVEGQEVTLILGATFSSGSTIAPTNVIGTWIVTQLGSSYGSLTLRFTGTGWFIASTYGTVTPA